MDKRAKPGSLLKYTGQGAWAHRLERYNRILEAGSIYTLKRLDDFGDHANVWLEEVDGIFDAATFEVIHYA